MSEENKTKISRRKMLKATGVALVATTSGLTGLASQSCSIDQPKKRLAMVMDLEKCIGCNACSVACKAENGVALGGFRTKVLEKETGEYPNTKRFFLPMMCNHCKDAPCIPACPNDAISQLKNGIVDIDKEKCQGFQLCIKACPYGAIYINPDESPNVDMANYPSRAFAKADKCNFCKPRVDEGLEPACSDTCPTGARIFGDMSDEKSEVYNIVKNEHLSGLLEKEGTGPQVFYRGGNKEVFDVKKSINKMKG
ncbi:MAG: 4Fe-4S dicluster domain-containing protein [Calditrichaeota bacterium]|nr:MAG: 4Fe-4S dicluster domain-containing protein [Calditrichota bacterium]MBL1207268.1 4Fe-4S dicluster domain-containing protein [Calditrichota bacterium]NOG47101.1 4Fe-4S dicluster domain-containing protein [Calditrichota bacterium]